MFCLAVKTYEQEVIQPQQSSKLILTSSHGALLSVWTHFILCPLRDKMIKESCNVCVLSVWVMIPADSKQHLTLLLCLEMSPALLFVQDQSCRTAIASQTISPWISWALSYVLSWMCCRFLHPTWELNCLPWHFPIDKFSIACSFLGGYYTCRVWN